MPELVIVKQSRRSKYGNVKTKINGQTFDSKKEATRYIVLKSYQTQKKISGLKTQVPFKIEINGELVCKYVADFVYYDQNGKKIVEDTKGMKTAIYKLKKKLMKAVLGIEIVES